MSYAVKEIYYTLQGEGAHTGRAAVFLRFAGCNLWTGREADRHRAVCRFCDTDFVGTDGPNGGRYDAAALAEAVRTVWHAAASGDTDRSSRPYVVLTGGEPTLQLDAPLLDALHAAGFEIAIETNGTNPVPPGVDWICVSPKAGTEPVQREGHELKLVFPQEGATPDRFDAAGWRFLHYYLQPMDGPAREENTRLALEYCLRHPRWRLSLQTHKLVGIP